MTAGAAADRRDEVFPSSGARVVQVLGPAAESWEWWRERPPGHSEFQDSSITTPANSGNNPSLSGYSRVPAGGARNPRLIRFVDQIFVHPLNRIVWYKISVISTHTDTKTSVSARKRLISLLMLHSLHTQAPNCLKICVKPGSYLGYGAASFILRWEEEK